MSYAKQALKDIVNQCDAVLSQFTAENYARPLTEFDGSSIGQHFRHILEFLECLSKGYPNNVVDYAARKRNSLYETDPKVAAAALANFSESLMEVSENQSIMVRAEYNMSERPEYYSTVGRELMFVYDHAIHHLAIIKVGMRCSFPEIKSDRDFGVSPSTIKARSLTT
ncbi:MAG: hypothetical protein J0L99_00410 [Chitinophagales bacterium]|nr:hypothetical protein [Chitinophagales bacterium]